MCLFCCFSAIKYYFRADVEFEREVSDTDELQYTTARFYLPPMISATNPLDIDRIITSLNKKIEPFTSHRSGWNISKILNLSLCVGAFRPTAGSSFIPTPAEIQKKKAIINIRNHSSNDCFQYSVLAALHPATSNLSNPYTYNKFMSELGRESRPQLPSRPFQNSKPRTHPFRSMS